MANVIKCLIMVTLNKLMNNVLCIDLVRGKLMFQIIKYMICILFCTVTLLLFRVYLLSLVVDPYYFMHSISALVP